MISSNRLRNRCYTLFLWNTVQFFRWEFCGTSRQSSRADSGSCRSTITRTRRARKAAQTTWKSCRSAFESPGRRTSTSFRPRTTFSWKTLRSFQRRQVDFNPRARADFPLVREYFFVEDLGGRERTVAGLRLRLVQWQGERAEVSGLQQFRAPRTEAGGPELRAQNRPRRENREQPVLQEPARDERLRTGDQAEK